jgi:rare lipoprotein A
MFAGIVGVLVACSTGGGSLRPAAFSTIIPKQPPRASEERIAMANLLPVSTEGTAVAADAARGQLLEPDAEGYDHVGMASWYGGNFHGRQTADGEVFDRTELTAAHLSLPLPSYVRVTNLENNRSIVLRVNDRGPYVRNRLIDVSEHAAELLAFRRGGSTKVRVQYVSAAPRHTDDTMMLLASYRGPSLPVADAVAFVQPEQQPVLGSGAAAAMRQLTQSASADDRIVMAFAVARNADN